MSGGYPTPPSDHSATPPRQPSDNQMQAYPSSYSRSSISSSASYYSQERGSPQTAHTHYAPPYSSHPPPQPYQGYYEQQQPQSPSLMSPPVVPSQSSIVPSSSGSGYPSHAPYRALQDPPRETTPKPQRLQQMLPYNSGSQQPVTGSYQGVVLTVDDPSKPAKTLQCDGCDARFARKHDLNRHRRIHTQEAPYICFGCDKSFRRSDARKRHWDVDPTCARRHTEAQENI